MYRVKVRLDTLKDVAEFSSICSTSKKTVSLVDDCGNCVNAKSFIGCTYSSVEWKDIYCVSEEDLSGKLINFII